MHSIQVDKDRRLIRAELSGFFTAEEVAAFARDEQAAAASLGCRSGEFGLLIATEGGVAQSPEVVAAFQRLMIDLPLKAARIATVTSGALLKLQLRRINTADRTAVFDDVATAEAWIAAGLPDS